MRRAGVGVARIVEKLSWRAGEEALMAEKEGRKEGGVLTLQ